MPPKSGSTPAASIPSFPRLGWTVTSTNFPDDAEWTQASREHLSGLRRISTPGRPYLKTSHAHQRRPLPDSTARLRNAGPTPGRLCEFRINRARGSEP